MSETTIRVVTLGKEYRLGRLRQRDTTLREALASGARRVLARVGSGRAVDLHQAPAGSGRTFDWRSQRRG